MTLRICSFDIGIVNFAQYIESVKIKEILRLVGHYQSLPAKIRNERIPKSSALIDIRDAVCLIGRRKSFGVYNLDPVGEKNPPYTNLTRKEVIAHLERHKSKFDKCDVFVIEQQYFSTFSFGRRKNGTEANVKAIKVAECVHTWLEINYPFKIINTFPSMNKTQILGAEPKLTKAQRKTWAVKKSRSIYQDRNDQSSINRYDSYKKSKQKQCDVSDAMLQCQAYKFRMLVCDDQYKL